MVRNNENRTISFIIQGQNQEAQLSQTDRACFVSLNISLSHWRSLKVVQS